MANIGCVPLFTASTANSILFLFTFDEQYGWIAVILLNSYMAYALINKEPEVQKITSIVQMDSTSSLFYKSKWNTKD